MIFVGLQAGGERGRGLASIYLAAQCFSLASCFAGVAAAGADEEEVNCGSGNQRFFFALKKKN